jgi:hypothetical protein
MLVLYAIITRRRTLSNIVGIYVVSGKVALIPMVNSIGMIYVNVVSVPIENDMCVCIYIYVGRWFKVIRCKILLDTHHISR